MTTRHAKSRFWLGLVIITFGVGLVTMLLFKTVPEQNQRIMDMGTGVILGWGGAVVMFFFGTSQSSSDKNEVIGDIARHESERPTGQPEDPVHTDEVGRRDMPHPGFGKDRR